MHGFFMDIRLYNKIKAIAQPNAYDDWRKQKIRQRIDAKRESRITIIKRLPKVNKVLATKLLSKEQNDKTKDLLAGRFSKLFTDSDYARNNDSLPPPKPEPQNIEEEFSEVSEEEPPKAQEPESPENSIEETPLPQEDIEANNLIDFRQTKKTKPISNRSTPPQGKRKIRFFEAKNDSLNPLQQVVPQQLKKQRLDNAPFMKRIEIEDKLHGDNKMDISVNGAKTFTFRTQRKSSFNKKNTQTTNHKRKGRRFSK